MPTKKPSPLRQLAGKENARKRWGKTPRLSSTIRITPDAKKALKTACGAKGITDVVTFASRVILDGLNATGATLKPRHTQGNS